MKTGTNVCHLELSRCRILSRDTGFFYSHRGTRRRSDLLQGFINTFTSFTATSAPSGPTPSQQPTEMHRLGWRGSPQAVVFRVLQPSQVPLGKRHPGETQAGLGWSPDWPVIQPRPPGEGGAREVRCKGLFAGTSWAHWALYFQAKKKQWIL